MTNIPPKYNSTKVEGKLYKFWEESGFFQPGIPGHVGPALAVARGEDKPRSYCIVIPPPNITSSLHMGHALDSTIQDCLIRWKRMQGYNTFWMPGVDHAGIATQNVVEKHLAREGKTRIGLGREEFVKRVWQWKKEYGDDIVQQLKLLGSSCDWGRLRFTMDEKYSAAVREEFVRLYKEGLIYRGNRIINWCPSCRTALSDIEVEHEEVEGKFYYIKYLMVQNGEITVATTRPETMLGDVAVAVHPDDDKYKGMVGKSVILPLAGREIKIIADKRVDPSFGTGAVKITPAHDPDDFEIGLTHDLPKVTVIGEDGKMTGEAGKYAGQDRYVCRENVLKDLKREGKLLKIENHSHSTGRCYRCGAVVEPLISLQWFVRMKDLARPAIRVFEEGKIRFIPERWTGVYINWMENIKDWCISRQIWWGHRIPVWYCVDCKFINVALVSPEKCEKCGSPNLKQDEDVLDTWFSSALWPFAGLGWPERTEALSRFYPTSVLVTGYDIICFWVARMIMTGMKFMENIPFCDVYIHGLVRDAKGRKMSKSIGNVIDPREIIKRYGTDALRMALVTALGGQDIYLGEERLEGMRNFVNKVWNAGRFILINLDPDSNPPYSPFTKGGRGDFRSSDLESTEFKGKLKLDDRWILAELQGVIRKVTDSLDNYRFSEAGQMLYEFTWHEFCDWYLELVKPRLRDSNEKDTVCQILLYVWERLLRLLHPFMPFITEELWQLLPDKVVGLVSEPDKSGKSIMVSSWPEVLEEFVDETSVRLAHLKYDVVRTGRQLRTEHGIPPGEKMEFIIRAADEEEESILNEGIPGLKLLLAAGELRVDRNAEIIEGANSGITISGTCVYMVAGKVDAEGEKKKLRAQLEEIEKGLKRCEIKLSNSQFLEKAPEHIVEKQKLKKKEFKEREEKLLDIIRGHNT